MNDGSRIVVVGASAAGLTAVETLRREGFTGRIAVVGDEPRLPYDRPPLSKQVLRGTWEPGRVALRGDDVIAGLDAEWLLGNAAIDADIGARRITLSDGRVLGYDGLVIATGVTPRRLPHGHELAGVHTLRTLDDALALRKGLLAAKSVVVIGAGFLGAEAAAVARQLGRDVTLVDPLPAPMVRQFGAQVGELVARLHTGNGVRVRCATGVTALTSDAGQVSGVNLDDGAHVAAELVLVAIGSTPNVGWLEGSGLSLGNGVECDALCQAAPGVVAAGDVASWLYPGVGRLRVEHRMNATEQGTAAARNLLGNGIPFAPVSYYWTDQFDVKIQTYGVAGQDADFRVVAGDPANGRFAAVYGMDGRTTAALTWNMPKEARTLRRLVVERASWRHALSQVSA